jgi:hypothetical protein
MKNFLAVPLLFALLSTPASATIISDTNVQFSFGTVNDSANNQPTPGVIAQVIQNPTTNDPTGIAVKYAGSFANRTLQAVGLTADEGSD